MGGKRKAYFDQSKKGGAGGGGASAADKKAKFMFDTKVKLAAQMSGFLITYNCKYTFCLNEAKKLLQQFSLPDEKSAQAQGGQDQEDDIEKMIKNELDSINSRDREFHVLDTGAKYTIFIYLKSVNPNQVVESIFDSIEESKKPLGRYVQRMMPVLNTCKAHLEDIEKCITNTLDAHDAIKACEETPFTYCFMFKASNNASISRESVFKFAGTYVQSKSKANKVDFDAPEYVLFIQIICNICYISFMRNYFKYRKYNLIEMGAKYSDLGQTKPQPQQPASKPKVAESSEPTTAPVPEAQESVEAPIIKEPEKLDEPAKETNDSNAQEVTTTA